MWRRRHTRLTWRRRAGRRKKSQINIKGIEANESRATEKEEEAWIGFSASLVLVISSWVALPASFIASRGPNSSGLFPRGFSVACRVSEMGLRTAANRAPTLAASPTTHPEAARFEYLIHHEPPSPRAIERVRPLLSSTVVDELPS